MAIRFLRYNDAEVLRKPAAPIKKITAGTLRLLEDMVETMHYHNGVGLAAPQVGISRKVIVVQWQDTLYQLINPEIVEREGEIVTEEGCLSFPGVWGEVKRSKMIKVKALNPQGEEVEIDAEGRLAVIFQHEIDHVNGEVFIDKIIRFTDPEAEEEEEESESSRVALKD